MKSTNDGNNSDEKYRYDDKVDNSDYDDNNNNHTIITIFSISSIMRPIDSSE